MLDIKTRALNGIGDWPYAHRARLLAELAQALTTAKHRCSQRGERGLNRVWIVHLKGPQFGGVIRPFDHAPAFGTTLTVVERVPEHISRRRPRK